MLGSQAERALIDRNLDRRTGTKATMLLCRRGEPYRTILPEAEIGAINGFAHKRTFKFDLMTA